MQVDLYFEKHKNWHAELEFLRHLILSTHLEETLKWGMPTYTLKGKNIVGIGAFKNHIALWLFGGVHLTDHAKVLTNAQEGTTKSMRQWRFTSVDEMDASLILDYLEESIENSNTGLKASKKAPQKIDTPAELQFHLDNDPAFSDCFNKLTSGRQKEYKLHIGSAKTEATRLKRLEKCIPLIFKGKGLNDKYRS